MLSRLVKRFVLGRRPLVYHFLHKTDGLDESSSREGVIVATKSDNGKNLRVHGGYIVGYTGQWFVLCSDESIHMPDACAEDKLICYTCAEDLVTSAYDAQEQDNSLITSLEAALTSLAALKVDGTTRMRAREVPAKNGLKVPKFERVMACVDTSANPLCELHKSPDCEARQPAN